MSRFYYLFSQLLSDNQGMRQDNETDHCREAQSEVRAARTDALVVDSDVDRWGKKTTTSANDVWTKVSEKDTRGAWSLFESCVPAGFAVPLHLHLEQDEWFWILDGAFVFEVAGEIYRLTTGMSLLAPRRLPHRWRKTLDSDGKLLILVQPANRMEDFFSRFAALDENRRQQFEVVNALFTECGMKLLGPPLGTEIE